jgi:hypothetical protein
MRLIAQGLLFLPLVLGYWYVHGKLAIWVQWLPDLFSERTYQLAGLLLGTFLCGALAGLIVSGPVHFLYRPRAIAVAAAIALLAGAFDAYHLRLAGALPFTKLALLLDLLVFLLALPLCMLLFRRLAPKPPLAPVA